MKLLTSCCVGVGLAVMTSAGAPKISKLAMATAHVNHVSDKVNAGDTGVGNRGGGSGGGGTGGNFVGMALAERHGSCKP